MIWEMIDVATQHKLGIHNLWEYINGWIEQQHMIHKEEGQRTGLVCVNSTNVGALIK